MVSIWRAVRHPRSCVMASAAPFRWRAYFPLLLCMKRCWRPIEKVRELWDQQKITVVFIEHDMDIVFKIAPTIIVLCYGRILAAGTPEEIRCNPTVIEAYLGTEDHPGATI